MPCWQYLLEDPSGLTIFVKLGHYCQFFAIKNKFVMNKHFHYAVLEGISQPTKKTALSWKSSESAAARTEPDNFRDLSWELLWLRSYPVWLKSHRSPSGLLDFHGSEPRQALFRSIHQWNFSKFFRSNQSRTLISCSDEGDDAPCEGDCTVSPLCFSFSSSWIKPLFTSWFYWSALQEPIKEQICVQAAQNIQ